LNRRKRKLITSGKCIKKRKQPKPWRSLFRREREL
jgi:hypothetical protein